MGEAEALTPWREALAEDRINESPARKSLGAAMVAMAVAITAANTAMPWWGVMLVGAATWYGLHKVAGLKINGAIGTGEASHEVEDRAR
jgi:hypothetical protein